MKQIQQNLYDSNTNDTFTVANSNLFLNHYKILLTAQENKYLGIF